MRKHVKFDEDNYTLYVQVKHDRDEDWTDFTVAQAREERERLNKKKAAKSHLFTSPESHPPASPKTRSGSTRKGSYVPTQRDDQSEEIESAPSFSGSWRPPQRDENMF